MYTDKEVKEILDRVYSEAYDAGRNDTLEYFEENYEFDSDDSFDLEDEYDYYTESSKNVRRQMDKLKDKDEYNDNVTVYRNGDADHKKVVNRGLDWAKYAKKSKDDGDSSYTNGVATIHDYYGNKSTAYTVGNKGLKHSSEARGRIKVADEPEEGKAWRRRNKLKQAIERNKHLVETRKDRELAKANVERANKPGLFKNKGNRY